MKYKKIEKKIEYNGISKGGRIPIDYGDKSITYRELNDQIKCIAGFLQKNKIQDNDKIILFMEKGDKIIEAMVQL